MSKQNREENWIEQVNQAIAELVSTGSSASRLAADALMVASDEVVSKTTEVSHTVGKQAYGWVEQGTEVVGRTVTPIVDNPFIRYATKVPGISWLMAALGQVDVEKVQQDVDKLRRENPLETPEQLARRVMMDTAMKAAGVGIVTNFVPPLAVTLFALDLAAVTALQAEMIYRIATIYGFSMADPARRGEVLAMFGLSMGGSGLLKLGLSFAEVIPLVGPVLGATSDATLIYALGQIACRYYAAKEKPAEFNSQFQTL